MHWADVLSQIPGPNGEHSVSRLQHGTLNLKLSAPVSPSDETPHDQDEVYIIVRGRGFLRREKTCDPFAPGDALFVPAGAQHQFEDFTDDLLVWVVFFGPPGGAAAAQERTAPNAEQP